MAPVWPGIVLLRRWRSSAVVRLLFAAGEKAGKKLHEHLHSVAQTGRLRLMEWGSSLAGADIGLC